MITREKAAIANKQIFHITGDGVTKEFSLNHELGICIVSGIYDNEYKGYDFIPDQLYKGHVRVSLLHAIPKGETFHIILVG